MTLGTRRNKTLPVILLIIWFALFLLGVHLYEGSRWLYLLFSSCYLCLIITACFYRINYAYLYFAIFLWLGYWLKLTAHTILSYPYQESTGAFVSTGASLDEVLMVATVGCCGVLLAWWIYRYFVTHSTMFLGPSSKNIAPSWYKNNRRLCLSLLMLMGFVTAVVNVIFGIQQSGLVPRIILHWPLNAVTYWLLAIGFALMTTTMLGWDVSLNKRASSVAFLSLLEAFFSSVSILSRGLYIFHVIPSIVSLCSNREIIKKIRRLLIVVMSLCCVVFFVMSLFMVAALRSYYYSGVLPDFRRVNSDSTQPILRLVVDRWIGVEGLMAVASYPNKNGALFYQALVEKSEIGKIGMYQRVAKSQYLDADANRFAFATLPGPMAFLYYSGSLLFVFCGMFLFTFVMMQSEKLVGFLTRNVFTCSLYGMTIANSIAQIGTTPSVLLKFYGMTFGFIIFVCVIQSTKRLMTRRTRDVDRGLVV